MFTAGDWITPTTVSVRARTGSGGRGPVYSNPVDVPMIVHDVRREVRNTQGELVISGITLTGDLDNADAFPPGAEVTVNGRTAYVITVSRAVVGDPDIDHIKVALT